MNISSSFTNRHHHQDQIEEKEVETGLLRQSKSRRLERFLKGPIPIREIAAAARLPGKALALLLAIHHQSDLTGKVTVTLPASLLTNLGISKDTKGRGLKLLERAGLVSVIRSKGRAARIQLRNANQGGTKWAAS
jgi:DNA-binding transcriptional ArsR family regulator